MHISFCPGFEVKSDNHLKCIMMMFYSKQVNTFIKYALMFLMGCSRFQASHFFTPVHKIVLKRKCFTGYEEVIAFRSAVFYMLGQRIS